MWRQCVVGYINIRKNATHDYTDDVACAEMIL